MANVRTIEMSAKFTMKMANFCKDGKVSEDYPCGTLLGLIDGETMEITNCFAYPTDTDEDLQRYELDMQRFNRTVNGDYLNVGWFTPAVNGKFIDREFLQTQASHQSEDPDAVALVYDPQKTVKGCLSMKAYRLSDKLLENVLDKSKSFNSDFMKESQLTKSKMLVEIPIVVTLSPLANILAQTLKARNPVPQNVDYSGLSHASSLEHQLKGMMQSVDELGQESAKFRQHQRSVSAFNQKIADRISRHAAENSERESRGEKPLPDVDLSNIQRPKNPERLTATLAAMQLDHLIEDAVQISHQSQGKIETIQAMENNGK